MNVCGNGGRRPVAVHLTMVVFLCAVAQVASGEEARGKVPLLEGLGEHHYAVTTRNPLAQRYFDQGLRLYYAFNHLEAIRAFVESARTDPQCAMCYWGIALAHGPNINAPMEPDAAAPAWAAVQRSIELAPNVTPVERALIRALAERYSGDPPADRAPLDLAYARAMASVVERFPDDGEAATLYAEALMNLSPWDYWTRDGEPRENTEEILASLEGALERNPDHPGANHFYIHALEAVQPERAVAAAERLAGLMPQAGHLVHMPGHIYIRVGRYEDAIRANQHAVHADETYIRDQNPELGIYVAGYYPHNYDFLAFAASMIAREDLALEAADKLATLAPEGLEREPGMTFIQHHQSRRLQMRVRFERWSEILADPAPPDDLPHALAMWHYAQGRALAATNAVEKAAEHLGRLRDLAADPELAAERLEFNTAGDVLAIAVRVLAGHIAVARGDMGQGIGELREAARLEDGLTYGEPPDWSVPVRQDLGAVLLEAGQRAEAERAFNEDLARFPKNTWSTHGLAMARKASAGP